MSDAVLVAVVTGGLSCLGSIVGVLASNRLMAYRLEQLEGKVDKLGGLIERVTVVEQSAKSAHKRVDKLEDAL